MAYYSVTEDRVHMPPFEPLRPADRQARLLGGDLTLLRSGRSFGATTVLTAPRMNAMVEAPANAIRVFISYSRVDLAFVDRLVLALEAHDIAVRIDRRDLPFAKEWQDELVEMVRWSDTVLFVISPNSIGSTWCEWELAQVEKYQKRLGPIVYHPVENDRVPDKLSKLQHISFAPPSDFDTSVDKLVGQLGTDIGWLRQHTDLADTARKWKAANQKQARDFVLRGAVLRSAQSWLDARPPSAPEPTAEQLELVAASERVANHRRRAWVAGATTVAVLSVGLAGLAYWQREVAKNERDQALTTESRFLASLADEETAAGNSTNGILIALEALPGTLDKPDRPYLRRAETALYRAVSAEREELVLRGHSNRVTNAEFSLDGSLILTSSADHTARIWEANGGKPIMTLKGHKDEVFDASFSPDGKLVVTASQDKTIRLWDAKSGNQITTLAGPVAPVHRCKFSPDGRFLLTGSGEFIDGPVYQVWDVIAGGHYSIDPTHGPIHHAEFSPNGELIVTAAGNPGEAYPGDTTARIWNVKTGGQVAVLAGHNRAVMHASFNRDGRQVVTASEDRTAIVWEKDTGRILQRLSGHSRPVAYAAFSPDGERVVTASWDGTARIWEIKTGTTLVVLDGHSAAVVLAEFSPDGRKILTTAGEVWRHSVTSSADEHTEDFWQSGGDYTARLWDVETGEQIAVLPGHDGLIRPTFSPHGDRILTTSTDHTARVWHTMAADEPLAVMKGHSYYVLHAEFSPDGERILTASADATARLWDSNTGKELFTADEHEDNVTDAAFTPDGRRIVTASRDGTARVFDAVSRKRLLLLTGHSGEVTSVTVSPDGKQILTTSYDDTARVWNSDTGDLAAVLVGHQNGVVDGAFSPDSSRVATASTDGTARLWLAASGEQIAKLAGHTSGVLHVEFGPDGSRIVTASDDQTARIWNAITGELLVTLQGHQGRVNYATFQPSGPLVLTAAGQPMFSMDRSARLWNSETGELVTTLEGHEQGVNKAVFSPDGRRVITTSFDGTARLWETETMRETGTMELLALFRVSVGTAESPGPFGGPGYAVDASFSPDGQHVVTASTDGDAKVWRVYPRQQALIDYANSIVPRHLTPAERKRFFLDAGEAGQHAPDGVSN